jgi:predicted membrane channel-forming protein YqfA (hemolysin III family)
LANPQSPPPVRKFIATLLLIFGLLAYAVITVTLIGLLAAPDWVKICLYALAGIAWIFPARHLLFWMETGHWFLPKQKK